MLDEIKNSKLKAIIMVISTFVFSIGLATSITSGVGDTYAAEYSCPTAGYEEYGTTGYCCPSGWTYNSSWGECRKYFYTSSAYVDAKKECDSPQISGNSTYCKTSAEKATIVESSVYNYVNLIANGGSINGSSLLSCLDSGDGCNVTLPNATRVGYKFKGYGNSASCTGGYSGTIKVHNDETFYACWVEENSGSDSGGDSESTVTCPAGQYYSGSGQCSWCIAGYYCPGGTFNSSDDGNLGLYECPSGTTSVAGSASCTTIEVETKTYTIKYDANGGSGAPASQTKTEGKSLTLSSTKPTRSGYEFLGWSTDKSATTATYKAGGSYTKDEGATLFAVWKVNIYTITYNANGGSGVPASQTKTHGKSLTLSSTKPTRSGYTFLGWNTDKSATTATYKAGGSYTKDEGATLFAVWSKDEAKTYTITYDANGGSGAPASQTKTHGKSLTLSSTKPTRSGYTFLGWSTDKSATTVMYNVGGTYTKDEGATLFAVWSQDSNPTISYDIKYDANGGSGAPASQTKTQGKSLTLSSTKPIRDGYTFLGWNTDKSATTVMYKAGDIYTKDEGATLYAVWDVYSKTDDEITNNNQTGNAFIYIVWAIGIGTLGYSVYYFRSKKNDI